MPGQPAQVVRWNDDKPHRCPSCHAVAIDMERPRPWRIYVCCTCGTWFSRWPRLGLLLPIAGVRCSTHINNPVAPKEN